MPSAVALAVQEVLAGAPVALVFEELLEIRQAIWEGIFAGVEADKVLHKLMWALEHRHPDRVDRSEADLALVVWRAIYNNDAAARSEARAFINKTPRLQGNNPVSSILHWPGPFWDALHLVAKGGGVHWADEGHFAKDPKDPEYHNPRAIKGRLVAVEAGVSEAVARAIFELGNAVRKTPRTAYKKIPEADLHLERELHLINTVLKRFPSKLEHKIREGVAFLLQGIDYDKEAAAERADGGPTYIAWTKASDLARSLGIWLQPDWENEQDNRLGWFQSRGRDLGTVWLRRPVQATTVAHELGHYVWANVAHVPYARQFFKDLLDNDLQASRDVGEFIRRMQLAFNGLQARETQDYIEHVLRDWGGEYVKQHASSNWTPKLRAAMAHGVGKAVDVLVSENEKLLGSWNEVWAEGFSHIIVGHATHVQVPGVMLDLIEYILRRA